MKNPKSVAVVAAAAMTVSMVVMTACANDTTSESDSVKVGVVDVETTGTETAEAETSEAENADAETIVDVPEDVNKPGDVDGNSKANNTDLIKVAAHVKGRKLLTGAAQKAADVNGDGEINISDVIKIAAHVKGKKMLY
ncbi:dockerin type I repeat-containing protein [Ruminococcus albus]|uniref:Dockerin domain-containing protein n=1 Tax=Ruminococcus albus TaxID=1264 RepID=A0A1H7PMB3_RUMAL|nr:dockerin type I repeat-containing protein [Ruminococcus albus]SEL36564.1 hypothetical protein SAMN05216469_1233 [Ruminococcus albus]